MHSSPDYLLLAAAIVLGVIFVLVAIRSTRRIRENPKPPSNSAASRIGHGCAVVFWTLFSVFLFSEFTVHGGGSMADWSPLLLLILALLIYLPRANNQSQNRFWRSMGQCSMLARYFIFGAIFIGLMMLMQLLTAALARAI